MAWLGLEAIYPKKSLSVPNREHKKYPYLLKRLPIIRPNQVWASDITYVRLSHGFAYLTVVMDWYSRYVIAWELSTTLDSDFCVRCLERALEAGKPEIFNTDQGVQYTSEDFTKTLLAADVRIRHERRGPPLRQHHGRTLVALRETRGSVPEGIRGRTPIAAGISASIFPYYNDRRRVTASLNARPEGDLLR